MTAAINIAGLRSGRLVAIGPTDERRKRKVLWRCQCDCGNEILCLATTIRVGDRKSCGCVKRAPNDHLRSFIERSAGNPDCWEWEGFRDKDGYGRTKFNGTTTVAHRAIYQIVCGQIPEGMLVCHSCDNPPCCRPDHLFLGTQKDNCLDAKKKDRHSRGMRNGIAKLTDDDVRAIRASAETQWTLAHRYGVWQGTIWNVIHKKRWQHVQD